MGVFKSYIKNYFLLDLADYFDIGGSFYINAMLFILFAAFIGAMLVTNHYRRAMHLTVKQLYRHRAFDADSAKTLIEIGLQQNRTVKRFLSRDGQLKAVVCRVGERRYTYEEYLEAVKGGKMPDDKIDFSSARFYLLDKDSPRVRRIFDGYNVGAVQSAAYAVLYLAIFVGVSLVMPEILAGIAGFGRL